MNIFDKEHKLFVMTITQLRVFIEVAEQRSFTKAGQALNMTQPAVSHAISSLETELDVTLIIRDRKQGILLTDIGKRILVYVREMLKNQEKIEQEVAAYKGLEVGTIKIGSFATASSFFLPKIIRVIQQQYPQLEILLYEGTINEVKDWLQQRTVDVGFLTTPAQQFDTLSLYQDKMVAVVPDDHPLQAQATIQLYDLKEEPLVVCQGGGEPPILDKLASEGLQSQVKYFVQQANTALNMIAEGLGVAILPELSISALPAGVQKRNLSPPICREVLLATQSLKEASVAVELFVHTTKQLFINGKAM